MASASVDNTPRGSVSGPSGSSSLAMTGTAQDAVDNTPQTRPRSNSALKPIGIFNDTNTCYINSTFQALSCTAPLMSLLHSTPAETFTPLDTHTLPPPLVPASRIPSLSAETLEPPLYGLLPVTRAFQSSLQKAWKMKDARGGTMGADEERPNRSMSLRSLLREIAKKYEQYDDYQQQDAHELLRHLLDCMEMEEQDVIKILQPREPKVPKVKARKSLPGEAISPMTSPLASPSVSQPGSPTGRKASLPSMGVESASLSSLTSDSSTEGAGRGAISEDERLIPFVNVLFDGSLLSVIVCEKCKSLSHSYEQFLDISLSLKGEEPRTRKRDKFKSIFRGKNKGDALASVMSDTELSDTEAKSAANRDAGRRASMDVSGSEGTNLSRNSSSSKGLGGLRGKPSFSFRSKKTKAPSPVTPSSVQEETKEKTVHLNSAPSSPALHPHHRGGPTPAQAAYIHRILSASVAGEHSDPLAKLRAAHSGHHEPATLSIPTDGGLLESLRAFTSVEVLEGENAFACRKCWRIKSGKYDRYHAAEAETDSLASSVPGIIAPKPLPAGAPTIQISSSQSSESSLAVPDERGRLGRVGSIASRSSAASAVKRAPSPLSRQITVESSNASLAPTDSASAASDTGALAEPESDDGDDGLSATDESTDGEVASFVRNPPGARPKPKRMKSSHFIMRRAFKRYMIAKAPEVLVFHFKRFKQTQKNMLFTNFLDLKKVDDFMPFPESLDLAPFLAPNRHDYRLHQTPEGLRAPYQDWASDRAPEVQPCMYRLYAVVVHLGTMVGGHYVAYCLVDPGKVFGDRTEEVNVEDGMKELAIGEHGAKGRKQDRRVWCFCSDTSIRLATAEEVLKAKAYLCFYERVHEREIEETELKAA